LPPIVDILKLMKQENRRSRYAAISLTVLGALLRLVPHPPNFAPIGATGIFSGSRLQGWQAYLVPVLAMILTDPIRSAMEGHFPAYSSMTVVIYASLLVYVFLGRTLLARSNKPGRIALVCLLGSTQFFLVTNFFIWLGSEVEYPHTFAGLIACYTAALPFFERTVLGDLFYTAVLTLGYLFLNRYLVTEADASQKVVTH
jgi:hypothetical protein